VNNLNYTSRDWTRFEDESFKNKTFRDMYFDRDSHFFDLQVNTSHSAVHVPTNVYDRSISAGDFIQWSEGLDEVFKQNYQSDPALSWQYFGSLTGVMRHYPAMAWGRNETDIFDCRKKSWYIETATCSKDVIMLVDSSGSMTGYRNYIAKLTIKSLLDTFSNNDFINIYNYSKEASPMIECVKDTLVQATPENIEAFNRAVGEIVPEGHANVTAALETAFQVLEYYRDLRKCDEIEQGTLVFIN
jgi:voltage-dependent calcium channel alpha-2/delta-4